MGEGGAGGGRHPRTPQASQFYEYWDSVSGTIPTDSCRPPTALHPYYPRDVKQCVLTSNCPAPLVPSG